MALPSPTPSNTPSEAGDDLTNVVGQRGGMEHTSVRPLLCGGSGIALALRLVRLTLMVAVLAIAYVGVNVVLDAPHSQFERPASGVGVSWHGWGDKVINDAGLWRLLRSWTKSREARV